MSEIELKRCPFCGGKAVYVTKNNVSGHHCVGFDYTVVCGDCGVRLPERYEIRFSLSENGGLNVLNDGRQIAADRWNRRAGEDGAE